MRRFVFFTFGSTGSGPKGCRPPPSVCQTKAAPFISVVIDGEFLKTNQLFVDQKKNSVKLSLPYFIQHFQYNNYS